MSHLGPTNLSNERNKTKQNTSMALLGGVELATGSRGLCRRLPSPSPRHSEGLALHLELEGLQARSQAAFSLDQPRSAPRCQALLKARGTQQRRVGSVEVMV